MAKSVDFKIKVDGKQLDLTKISFKDFNKVITDAKKNLKDLPLTDPRYKTLSADIKTAEKAWKEATKAAGDFNNENKQGAEDLQTYKQQIRETTNELQKAEQQFGKNSEEANKLRERLKELRDEQDDFNETTRKLDDSLAGIPGPIGAIGQSMQQFGAVTNSAKSALTTLGNQFNTTDKIVKGTLIGIIVGLLVSLVAAVMNAAKSFKPLQDAFAKLDDAFGAVMNALKPLTDFILNIVVGAIGLLADAITFVAEAFGGVSNGAAQATLDLEREIAKQERTIGRLGDSLGTYTKNVVDAIAEQNKALLEINKSLKDNVITQKEAQDQELILLVNHIAKLKKIRDDYQKSNAAKLNETLKLQSEAYVAGLNNEREIQKQSLDINAAFDKATLSNEKISAENRKKSLEESLASLNDIEFENKKQVIGALKLSISEEQFIIDNAELQKTASIKKNNNERTKLLQEFAREDVRLTTERSLAIQQLSTELIREDSSRNLQAAKDNLESLKEQQRIELEDAKLAGVTLKNLKEKQVKEQLVAIENIRKAQLQFDAVFLQAQIDQEQRFAIEAGVGTQQYFEARRKQIQLEFEKELLLADGNQNEIQNVRTKYWKAVLELDKEGLQAQINQIQMEYDGLYEGTVEFFDKQRELEKKNYELRQKELQGNYDALEALNRQHQKNMNLIDAAQVQNSSDIQMRKFAALGTMNQAFFDEARKGEEAFYEAERKRAGDNNALLEVIELEHIKRVAEIDAQQKEAKLQVYAAIAQITAEFGSILSGLAQEQLRNAQGTDKERFESAKKFAKAAIIVERVGAIGQIVANTGIANAKAVAASPLTFGQPWVTINSIAAGVSIAGIIAAAIKSINDINGQEFQPSGGTGGNRMGRGYEKGGLIDGPRHAQGGTLIEAEGGEAVMTRGAVTMFGPLLSMMNQAGGGTTFQPNLMTTLMDKPVVSNPSEDEKSMIVKTYVVESELTSSQQRQARLKDLSTL